MRLQYTSQTETNTTILDEDGESRVPATLKVGEIVWFKFDYERAGKIVAFTKEQYGKLWIKISSGGRTYEVTNDDIWFD